MQDLLTSLSTGRPDSRLEAQDATLPPAAATVFALPDSKGSTVQLYERQIEQSCL